MNPLNEGQADLVERIGVLHDRMGMRPAAGRILGLLIVAPEGELTFDEIREALDLSKSATSTALKLLQEIGTVVYRTRSGDRKRYFQKNFQDWEKQIVERGLAFLDVRFLLAEALEARGNPDPESAVAFERLIGFLDHLAEVVRRAHDQWHGTTEGLKAGSSETSHS